MSRVSPLKNIIKIGKFGNFENKKKLTKISEVKDLLVFQVVKYKNSNLNTSDLKLDQLNLPNKNRSSSNKETRILWMGPNTWFVISKNNNFKEKILNTFSEKDFSVTDLSHSRAVIQLEGDSVKEILKKGCPIDIDSFLEDSCANSVFNGITITIDLLKEKPETLVWIMALRSFGNSLYESISDATLEFGLENRKFDN